MKIDNKQKDAVAELLINKLHAIRATLGVRSGRLIKRFDYGDGYSLSFVLKNQDISKVAELANKICEEIKLDIPQIGYYDFRCTGDDFIAHTFLMVDQGTRAADKPFGVNMGDDKAVAEMKANTVTSNIQTVRDSVYVTVFVS